ncbi:MAG: MATE family multidrug resistance protein, partial [Lysobacterales bacterium]
SIFLTNPETLDLAYLPMILWALMISFDTLGMVLMNALIGAGDTKRSMWISVIAQWAFFLPIAYVVGPMLGYGLVGVWIVNGFYRMGQALVSVQQWHGRKWAAIDL